MELKKLQGLIQESTDQFDEVLKALFLRKIKTQMVIYQVRTACYVTTANHVTLWYFLPC